MDLIIKKFDRQTYYLKTVEDKPRGKDVTWTADPEAAIRCASMKEARKVRDSLEYKEGVMILSMTEKMFAKIVAEAKEATQAPKRKRGGRK